MKFKRLRHGLRSATLRLAESYLLIIMAMSIGFSLVFYFASSHQLGRQLPPHSLTQQASRGSASSNTSTTNHDPDNDHDTDPIDEFLHSRIDEGRLELRTKLLYVNVGALLLGGVVSYLLARRTLKPIEAATEAQIQFVNDASHELRTPLTAIKAGNDVALRNSKLTLAAAKRVIQQNSDDAERLKALSDGLLTLAHNNRADLVYTAVGLQEIVGTAMTKVVQQASQKDVAVHDEVASVSVVGNKAALEQVLVILLDNAVKYSNAHSHVYLRTRPKGKHVYLDVIDEGVGIRASDVEHIFRRFYRADHARSTDGKRSGYGLGLSIAARIMESHGSTIEVHSKPGGGSVFTLKLHIAAA